MVGPQNLKPRCARSLLIARETAVSAGIWRTLLNRLIFGLPSTKSHNNLAKPGPFSIIQPGLRREHGAFDLCAIADDAGILHQPLDLFRRVTGNLFRREAVKGAAKILALAQNRDPGEAGLETVEHELFIERAIVVFGHAPFLVVIGDIERVVLRPGAAQEGVNWVERLHSAAFAPSGNAKRAHSGLSGRMTTPPATSSSPRDSASATRSRRRSASPWPAAA